MQIRATENLEEFGNCGCGRSPNGKCVGWHALTEEQWAEQKTQLIHNLQVGHGDKSYRFVEEDSGEE